MQLPADVNADGIVNVDDFAAVAAGVDAAGALPLQVVQAALLAAPHRQAILKPSRAHRQASETHRNTSGPGKSPTATLLLPLWMSDSLQPAIRGSEKA